jgi:soluble lytic murein transglycosylase-like protein
VTARFAQDDGGQAAVLLVGLLVAFLVGVVVLRAVAYGVGQEGAAQRAADLAALAGARTMHAGHPRLYEPPVIDGKPNPAHLETAAYLARAREAARTTAAANGADDVRISFPEPGSFAPVRIRVAVHRTLTVRIGDERRSADASAVAEAELAPGAGTAAPGVGTGGGYDGPLAYRQGKPMRPDVALAFDRMERAAREDAVALSITSGFRSDAEQAVLFARNPDPKWVARPGTSLHRMGTELDLGPPSAYGWLAANATRFHFVQRYAWEAWHYGFTLNARSSPPRAASDDGARSVLPDFVPARFAPAIARASQRWNVSGTLLAAQIYVESNFNPFAGSNAGAQGISQFMPGTARDYGLANPFDPVASIDAQAHMMRDLLRRFATVPLALAAYNAGPQKVAACMCIPPIAETRAYVARILALTGGAGEGLTGTSGGLEVRLVR